MVEIIESQKVKDDNNLIDNPFFYNKNLDVIPDLQNFDIIPDDLELGIINKVDEIDAILWLYLKKEKSKTECVIEFKNNMNKAIEDFDFELAKAYLDVITWAYYYELPDGEIFKWDFLINWRAKWDEYFDFTNIVFGYYQIFLKNKSISAIIKSLMELVWEEYSPDQQSKLLESTNRLFDNLISENYDFDTIRSVYTFLTKKWESHLDNKLMMQIYNIQNIEENLNTTQPQLLNELLIQSGISNIITIRNSEIITEGQKNTFTDKTKIQNQISASLNYCETNEKYRLRRMFYKHIEQQWILDLFDEEQKQSRTQKTDELNQKEKEMRILPSYKEIFDVLKYQAALENEKLQGDLDRLELERSKLENPEIDIEKILQQRGWNFSISSLKEKFSDNSNYMQKVATYFPDSDRQEADNIRNYPLEEIDRRKFNLKCYSEIDDLVSNMYYRGKRKIWFEELMQKDENEIQRMFVVLACLQMIEKKYKIDWLYSPYEENYKDIWNWNYTIDELKIKYLEISYQIEKIKIENKKLKNEQIILISDWILNEYKDNTELMKNNFVYKLKKEEEGELYIPYTYRWNLWKDYNNFNILVNNLFNYSLYTWVIEIWYTLAKNRNKDLSKQWHDWDLWIDLFSGKSWINSDFSLLISYLVEINNIKKYNKEEITITKYNQDLVPMFVNTEKIKTVELFFINIKDYNKDLFININNLTIIEINTFGDFDLTMNSLSETTLPPKDNVSTLLLTFYNSKTPAKEKLDNLDYTKILESYPNLKKIEFNFKDWKSTVFPDWKQLEYYRKDSYYWDLESWLSGIWLPERWSYSSWLPDNPNLLDNTEPTEIFGQNNWLSLTTETQSYRINNMKSIGRILKWSEVQENNSYYIPSWTEYFRVDVFTNFDINGKVSKNESEQLFENIKLGKILTKKQAEEAKQQNYQYNIEMSPNSEFILPIAKGLFIYDIEPRNENIKISQNSQWIYKITSWELKNWTINLKIKIFYKSNIKTTDEVSEYHTNKFLWDFENKPHTSRFKLKDFRIQWQNDLSKKVDNEYLETTENPDQIAENIKYYIQTQSFYCLDNKVSKYYKKWDRDLDIENNIPEMLLTEKHNFFNQIEKRVFWITQNGENMMLMDCDLANVYAVWLLRDCGIPARLVTWYHKLWDSNKHWRLEYRNWTEWKILDCTPTVRVSIENKDLH